MSSRVLKAGGPGALAVWRREAERRGENWETEVMETFEDVFEELFERLEDEVWPNRMAEAFRKHFGFDEDLNIQGCCDSCGHYRWDCTIWIPGWNGRGRGRHLYVQESTQDEVVAGTISDKGVDFNLLALLYIDLAFQEARVPYYIELKGWTYIDKARNVWILKDVYSRTVAERSQTLEMPLAYLHEAQKAVAWLQEQMRSQIEGVSE